MQSQYIMSSHIAIDPPQPFVTYLRSRMFSHKPSLFNANSIADAKCAKLQH